jgi:hypothetical protein
MQSPPPAQLLHALHLIQAGRAENFYTGMRLFLGDVRRFSAAERVQFMDVAIRVYLPRRFSVRGTTLLCAALVKLQELGQTDAAMVFMRRKVVRFDPDLG